MNKYKLKEDLTLGDLRQPRKSSTKNIQLDLKDLTIGKHIINRQNRTTVEIVETFTSPFGNISIEAWEYNGTIHYISMENIDQWRLPKTKIPSPRWFEFEEE